MARQLLGARKGFIRRLALFLLIFDSGDRLFSITAKPVDLRTEPAAGDLSWLPAGPAADIPHHYYDRPGFVVALFRGQRCLGWEYTFFGPAFPTGHG